MHYSRPSPLFIILVLGALSTVSPFSIDMYLPTFPQIAKEFGTTPARISLSVASYFVGLALGQIIYGPLLDRFGRKKPLLAGLIVYILACIGCALSRTTESLVVLRFIQALGGCAAQVAAMAIVRDFFPREETSKIISLLMLVLGVSPLLAPSVGGLVASWLGWPWLFILLAIIVMVIGAVTWFGLPEGHTPDPTVSLRPLPIFKTFVSIFRHPQFHTYALASAFSFAGLFVYVAGSPVIFMEYFKVTPKVYGGIFALLSIGFIGGSQLNVLAVKRFSNAQVFRAALSFQVAVSLVFLLGVMRHWYGLNATIALFFLSLACLGLTGPNGTALALEPFTRNVGSAAALIGILQIGLGAVASSGVGFLNARDIVPMIALLALATSIAGAILVIGSRNIRRYNLSCSDSMEV